MTITFTVRQANDIADALLLGCFLIVDKQRRSHYAENSPEAAALENTYRILRADMATIKDAIKAVNDAESNQ